MQRYEIRSSFNSLPIEVFYYPAKQPSSQTIFLLKGLYGLHDPASADSWDCELIASRNDHFNFVAINTARIGGTREERSGKEAFVGKTFEQECDDVRLAYRYIKEEVMLPSSSMCFVANSFGGTTLLGCPDFLAEIAGIIMIGSGCGRSQTTTKPLLTTLYDEERLLGAMRAYPGVFAFVRGGDDSIVPKDSQDKIIGAAQSSSVRIVQDIRGVKHDLSPSEEGVSSNRNTLISGVLDHVVI